MTKPRRRSRQNEERAADSFAAADETADLPQLDRAGGITREDLTEAGGGRDVERHDRTRDRELKPEQS